MRALFFQLSPLFPIHIVMLCSFPAHLYGSEGTYFDKSLSLLDAVRYTIAHETNIKMEESQVTMTLGSLQVATGKFDINFSTKLKSLQDDTPFSEPDALAIGHAHQLTRTYSLTPSLTKTFRYGTSIDGSLGIARSDNRYPEGTEDTDNGTISFTILQPLFRGRGVEVAGAEELSKKQLYEAELYNLRRTVSQRIFETTTSYWNYQGALEKVKLYELSIQTIKESIDKLQELIDGGEKPASDMNHYLANLATRKVDLLSAKQELLFSTQALAVAMGIPYTQEVALPPPLSHYPDPDISLLQTNCQWLTDIAIDRRNDLLAKEKNLLAAKYVLEAAKNGLLPQLDLALNAKYSDVVKGAYEQDSTSISAWLNYEIPVGNNVATGQMLMAKSQYKQIHYEIEGLKRTISSQISNSVEALKTYSYIKKQYQKTEELDEQRVKNEKIQYSLGTSNLLLVIAVEDSLTTTRINLIDSKVNMANALIQLRHATGTTLGPDQTTYHINKESLTAIPEHLSLYNQ